MQQKYYRVEYLDLNETYVVAANSREIAEEEAFKILRDRGLVPDKHWPPAPTTFLGQVRISRAREMEKRA
jgi:hypothetical protein